MGLMKYQFDNNSNGDIYSSPDQRNPDELKAIYLHQSKKEEEDREKAQEIVKKIISSASNAPLHQVRVGNESCPCHIIEFCAWWAQFALVGDQCFPVDIDKKGNYVLKCFNSMGAEEISLSLLNAVSRYMNRDKFYYKFL